MKTLSVFVVLLISISAGAFVAGNRISELAHYPGRAAEEYAVQEFLLYQDACQGSLLAVSKFDALQEERDNFENRLWKANRNTNLAECVVSELIKVRMKIQANGEMDIEDLVLIASLGEGTPLEVLGEVVSARLAAEGEQETDDRVVFNPGTIDADLTERVILAALVRNVARAYGLDPLTFRAFELDPKFTLGQMLFFDPILSGDRTVSCATCHLSQFATTDGRALSLGPGAEGIGTDRTLLIDGEVHRRNSMDLWNRDHNQFRAAFWDGRVEMVDPIARIFRTPLGEALPSGIENVLAAQALFPLLAPDEMLGEPGTSSPANLNDVHASLPNELWNGIHDGDPLDASVVVFENLLARLLGSDSVLEEWQHEYRELFQAAYPERDLASWSIVDVANAIAHFEELAFATRATPWDHYLSGGFDLSVPEMRGVLLFFGRGRCSLCHSGPLFSDFEYHSVGVPAWNQELGYSDIGRFEVTGDEVDKHTFRTPPLRNVTVTAPYFHDGSQPNLAEAIWQHVDPYRYANDYREDGGRLMVLAEIEAVDPLLESIVLSARDVESLVSFLSLLEDTEHYSEDYVPERVPSGLRAH